LRGKICLEGALSVMAGLVPAIHAVEQTTVLDELVVPLLPAFGGDSESEAKRDGVDGRDKPGHDGNRAF
jgi:hypothetical protein